jgi:hypothetical protein
MDGAVRTTENWARMLSDLLEYSMEAFGASSFPTKGSKGS